MSADFEAFRGGCDVPAMARRKAPIGEMRVVFAAALRRLSRCTCPGTRGKLELFR
jgi:hypothetical protein